MKLRLDQEAITNEFFEDTRLLGIMAPIKNYQFCWQLNNLLGYNFRLSTNIEVQMMKKERRYYFSLYHHVEKNSFLNHYIYHNQCNGEYLLPEFRHMDFLWLMKDDIVDESKCLGITASIKSITGVQLVAELTNEKIKNKGNLVF